MKARPNSDRKRNEATIISTPLLSISFHKGAGSFSVHRSYRDFPLAFIMVSRGDAITVKTGVSVPVQIHANECQLFFEEGLSPEYAYKGTKKWEFFEIKLSSIFLKELPVPVCETWGSFMKKVRKGKTAILTASAGYCNNTVKNIAYSLLREQFTEPTLRERYFHVKVQEVLLHTIQELLSPPAIDPRITGKEHMLAARIKLIIDKAETTREFSIQSLVAALGTNETTIKQSFKKVTGTSIYRYYMHKQMTIARQLLNDGISVTDVALIVGYSTVGHFSYQFRKYFGTNPGNFKSNQ